MKGATTERVQALINECHNTGKIMRHQIKGLSDSELHELINSVVKGGVAVKAAAYSSMKDHI